MSNPNPQEAASNLLRDALLNTDDTRGQSRAFNALAPLVMLLASKRCDFVRQVVRVFAASPNESYRLLLAVLHPRWCNGGEDLANEAPPFAEVAEDLMTGLRAASGDAAGMIPPIIGRYGPDAVSVLPELVERLRTNQNDCMIAPGLPWTIYQIGGLSEDVREVLIEVARNEGACPHARPIACEILTLNEVSWTE